MNGGCPHGDACYYKHPKVEEPRRSAYKRSQPTEVDYYGRNKSSSSRVFIGNIDMPTVDAHDIEQLFKPYGTISEIRVHMGYMFVQFDNAISAQNSLRANGAIMGRKPIAVQMASDKDIGGSSHMNSSLGKRSSQYDDDDMSPSLKRHKRSDVYGAPQPYDRREYRDPYYDDYYRYEQPLHQQQQSSYEYGYPRESRTPDQYRQSQQPASANNNRTRVFIKNLPRNTEWWGLKDFFKQCGLVKRADPFRDEHGACKGYGIVEFESEAAALHAINNLNGTLFNNRPISVSHVNEDIMPVAHGRALQ
jgi:RNA recognition motif-containing protein